MAGLFLVRPVRRTNDELAAFGQACSTAARLCRYPGNSCLFRSAPDYDRLRNAAGLSPNQLLAGEFWGVWFMER